MCHYHRGKKFHYSLRDALRHSQDHEAVVHLTYPSRSYATFATWKLFELWYGTLSVKHLDEVITSTPQKFRVDIDIPSKHSRTREFYEACVEDVCITISSILACYGLSCAIARYDSNVHTSCKYSTHIVLYNLLMPSSEVCLSLARVLHHSIDADHRQYIDMCIYKRTQNFRMEYSSKPGEYRPKTRSFTPSSTSYGPACHGSLLHQGLITCKYDTIAIDSSIGDCIRRMPNPHPQYFLSRPSSDWREEDHGDEWEQE